MLDAPTKPAHAADGARAGSARSRRLRRLAVNRPVAAAARIRLRRTRARFLAAPRHLTICNSATATPPRISSPGRVRERLQQVFGDGGVAYIVPGKPHVGVRSALFDSDASDGWSYEALQKSDEPPLLSLRLQRGGASRRRHAEHARARRSALYDAGGRLPQAARRRPRRGAGRRRAGAARSISTAPPISARRSMCMPAEHGPHGFHDIAVRALERRAGDGDRGRGGARRRRRLLPQPRLSRRHRAIAAEADDRQSRRRSEAHGSRHHRARLRHQRGLQRRSRRRRLHRAIRADRAPPARRCGRGCASS